jgi:tetratricopeptide (TPR) repeat protein
MDLYYDRIWKLIYYKFGAHQTQIELLRALFPDGEDNLPRLKNESAQAWTLNELANSYARSGRSRGSISLFKMANEILKKQDSKRNLAVRLGNLADNQIKIGELNAAEANLRRRIEICREINDEFEEAVGHNSLGLLLAYRGKFMKSEHELNVAQKDFDDFVKKGGSTNYISVVRACKSIRFHLMSNADGALKSAKKARELVDVEKVERDIICAEYLLGAAHLMKRNFVEAEEHLTEALTRDRKINLVEFEPDILLEFAKHRLEQNHKEEALKFAEEALQIADRCEYRLKQADIQRFLAEYYLDAGDLKLAKNHGEIAKERAECGHKPALEKAEKLLNEIERRWK